MNILSRDISVSIDRDTYKQKVICLECEKGQNLFAPIKSKTYSLHSIYFSSGNIKFGRFLMKSLGYDSKDYKIHKSSKCSCFRILKGDLTFDPNDYTFIRVDQELIFK